MFLLFLRIVRLFFYTESIFILFVYLILTILLYVSSIFGNRPCQKSSIEQGSANAFGDG